MKPWVAHIVWGVAAFAVSAGVLAAIVGDELRHVIFAAPLWFALAPLPLLALALRAWLAPRPATLGFSRARTLERMGRGLAGHLAELPTGLRVAAALWLVVAMARPTSSRLSESISKEGIDIAIALDMSESMKNEDMYPIRLEAAKTVIDAFIRRRPRDRIALVAFGKTPTTVAPLTMDHGVLRGLLARLRIGVIDGTQTALGAGLGMALNRLADPERASTGDEGEAESRDDDDADDKEGSKVVLLVTDGVHTAAGNEPDTVAQEAARRGVRVYTVLIGRHAGSVDPAALERIASATGGFAYTAEDQAALEGSFQDLLDKLETAEVESQEIRAELFWWALWPAWILLLIDITLRSTRLRRFP